MSMQEVLNILTRQSYLDRSQYHLTLRELIDALEAADPDGLVYCSHFDGRGATVFPTDPHSYRGYYSDLCLNPTSKSVTVEQLLPVMKACVGKTFTGWKGGDFVMEDCTPLWIAPEGETGLAIVGVQETKIGVELQTKELLD